MTGRTPWDHLLRETRDAIRATHSLPDGVPEQKVCGCHPVEPSGRDWWLCSYHAGYDAGAEAAGT